jgi:hypothetical protein
VATLSLCVLAITLFAAATWGRSSGAFGYAATGDQTAWPLRYETTCYGEEQWEGRAGRWCGIEGWWSVPLKRVDPNLVALSLRVGHPEVAREPVRVEYGNAAGFSRRILVDHHDWIPVAIPREWRAIVRCVDEELRRRRCVALRFSVSRTFRPSDEGTSGDTRELGVAVRLESDPEREIVPEEVIHTDGFESGDTDAWWPVIRVDRGLQVF